MPSDTLDCVIMAVDLQERVAVNDGVDITQTNLYVDHTVSRVSEIGRRHGGRALSAANHAVTMRFPTPDDAVRAACAIHEIFSTTLAIGQAQVLFRVAMDFGRIPIDAGGLDAPVFARAGRLVKLAGRKQVLLTEDAVERLSPVFRKMVYDTPERLQEGEDHVPLYEIVCNQDDFGSLIDTRDQMALAGGALRLGYRQRDWRVSLQNPTIIAGRSPQSDIIVEGHWVSRFHVRFEYRQGKFVLVDQSRNGCYVKFQTGKEVYLKHQELDLWGSGTVYLGERKVGEESQIAFVCEA